MQKRRLNVKLLIWLGVGCLVLMGGVYFLHGFQVRRTAGGLLRRATEAEQRGDLTEASDLLQRYVNLHRKDYPVYATLANVLARFPDAASIDHQDLSAGYGVLEQIVLEVPPDVPEHEQIRRSIVDFALHDKIRQYKPALDDLELLLDKHPGDVELNLQNGKANAGALEHADARRSYCQLIGLDAPDAEEKFHLDPKDVDFDKFVSDVVENKRQKARKIAEACWGKGVHEIEAYVILAGILERSGTASSLADAVMDQMVKMNADSVQAHLERGRYRHRKYLDTRDADMLAAAGQDMAKARELKPDDGDVILASATLAMEAEDYETARKYLEAGIKAYPKDDRMYISIADAASRGGDNEAAMAYIQRGIGTLPGNVRLLRFQAEMQLRTRDVEAVRKTIAELKRAGARQEGLADLEARILLVEGKWAPAAEKLEQVRPLMSTLPEQMQRVDLLLGQCYDQMGQFERAKDAYDRALTADPTSSMGRAARIALSRARAQTERRAPAPEEPAGADKPAAERPFDEVLAMALANNPEASDAEKKRIEATLRLQRQEYGEARDVLAQGRKDHPDDAGIWTASIQLAIHDPGQGLDEALRLLVQAREKFAGNEQTLMTEELVRASHIDVVANDSKRGGPEAARKLLEEAATKYGDTTLVRIARMKLLVGEGDDLRDQLRKLEEGIDARDPAEQLQFWNNIWMQYARNELFGDARRALGKLAELQPNNLKVKAIIFDLALDAQDNEAMAKAIADIRDLGDETGWKRCEACRLVFLVSQGQKDKSALNEAQQLLNDIKEKRPEWSEPYRLQAEIALLQGDDEAAIASYEQAIERGLSDSRCVKKLYALLSRAGRDEEAQQTLARLNQQQREAAFPEQEVENLMRAGETDKALKMAQDVVDKDPNNAARHLWHGQILSRAKDTEAARGAFLSRANDTEAAKGAFRRAVDLTEAAMGAFLSRAKDTKAANDHVKAAKTHADAARGAFRRAVDLAPQLSQAWLTLIASLVLNNEPAAAEAELRRAQLNLAQDELPLVMARGNELLGKPAEAERHFHVARKADPGNLALLRTMVTFYLGNNYPGNDKTAKAARWLNEILRQAGSAAGADPNVAWARRTMARLLAARGGYADAQRAIGLIRENAVDGQLPPEDTVEIARILAARPEPAPQQEAVGLLEQMRQQDRLGRNERLILAQLYHRADRWPECRSLMNDLVAQDEANFAVEALYCRMLLDREDLGQAARRIARLESLDPDNAMTRELKVNLLAKQGETAKAAATLRQMLPAEPQKTDVGTLQHVAGLMIQLEQFDEAEKLFRAIAKLEPRAIFQLGSFLGRYGDLDQAFTIFDSAHGTAADVTALRLAVDSVNRRRDEVGDRYDARLEAWFERLSRENPASRAVLLQLAQFRDGQGKYDEVKQIYRRLLNQPDLTAGPERATVLNNLAYILALQGTDGKEGIGMVEEAVKMVGPAAEILDTRAMLKLSLGDVKGALEDIQLALVSGRSALKLLHRALIEFAAADKSSAAKTLQEAHRRGLEKEGVYGLEREKYEELARQLGASQARQLRTAA